MGRGEIERGGKRQGLVTTGEALLGEKVLIYFVIRVIQV